MTPGIQRKGRRTERHIGISDLFRDPEHKTENEKERKRRLDIFSEDPDNGPGSLRDNRRNPHVRDRQNYHELSWKTDRNDKLQNAQQVQRARTSRRDPET